jgi:NADH:ubiquinone oxidoreductase subunit D
MHLGVLNHVARDFKIADLIAIAGSFDYVIPDIDR